MIDVRRVEKTQPMEVSSAAMPPATSGRRQRVNQKRTGSVTLPVAGTTIVTNSLYGDWKVEAFLDGERDTPCSKPLSFTIEP
jgi:hypothetical protein